MTIPDTLLGPALPVTGQGLLTARALSLPVATRATKAALGEVWSDPAQQKVQQSMGTPGAAGLRVTCPDNKCHPLTGSNQSLKETFLWQHQIQQPEQADQ